MPDRPPEPSKSQRKREALAARRLGERLTELSPEQLGRLDLPDTLRTAIEEARAIKQHGGRRRQLQLIGKLLRGIDTELIQRQLDGLLLRERQAVARFRRLEHWRDALLERGDDALGEVLQAFPHADRQRLRQLVRNARAEQQRGKPPKAARELFRLLRALQDQADTG